MSLLERMKREKFLAFAVLLFTLSAGIVIGTLINTSVSAASKEQAAAPNAAPLTVPPLAKMNSELAELVKRVEPSVVYIRTDFQPKQRAAAAPNRRPRQSDPDEDEEDPSMDLFRRFFGGPMPPGVQPGIPNAPRPRGSGAGTGFVVDKNGYIITNNHVVRDADNIYVKFPKDETEYKAKVIGTDKESDIAVLKIDAKRPLPSMKIANSDGVQVGDTAIAIGAPFGLETSVTSGIVSALGRDINSEAFQRFIQTDAAINPGNSGGPLLNRNGEVIGVNTMIATESGGSQGIGFALPMNMAAKVYNSIIQSGRMVRGSIGITFQKSEKPETFKALGLQSGVFVQDVRKGGPAEKAGIKKDDVLLAMNGKPFKDGDDLIMRIADTPVGNNVDFELERDGKRMHVNVAIEDRLKVFKNDPRVNPQGDLPEDLPAAATTTTAKFGIGIVPITDTDRGEMGLEDKRGVKVTRVEEGSFAEEIGIRVGDVIVSINRTAVFNVDDVRKVQGTLKSGDAVAFRVMRGIQAPAVRGQRSQAAPQWQAFYLSGTLPASKD